MNNLDHIFGDITEQLKSLKADKMYKYKIVASFNGGKFKQIALCKTEEETIKTMEKNRTKYGQGWVVTYYNIED
tara:strand:+ start:7859 stop:8080 length:222 start_codon:yes stop_codon:yes gene_type:complete